MNKPPYFVYWLAALVLLSVILSVLVMRGCFSFSQRGWLSLANIICGSISQQNPANPNYVTRLNANQVVVVSEIPESQEYSIARGRDSSRLVDGSYTTLAAPADKKIDYVINFLSPYNVKAITIYWGDYGINKNYINKWSLESTIDGENWEVVGEGGRPGNDKTFIEKDFNSNGLRLRAESSEDWIGVYEVEIIARPI